MEELYVVIDVGCLECRMGSSVLAVTTDEQEAHSVAEARIKGKGEGGELREPPTHPSERDPADPDTVIALAKCWGNQSSVEVHRIPG